MFVCVLQLFKKPHPPKRVRSKANGDVASVHPSSNSDKIFFHHLDNLRPSLAPVKGTCTHIPNHKSTDPYTLSFQFNLLYIITVKPQQTICKIRVYLCYILYLTRLGAPVSFSTQKPGGTEILPVPHSVHYPLHEHYPLLPKEHEPL